MVQSTLLLCYSYVGLWLIRVIQRKCGLEAVKIKFFDIVRNE